MIAVRSADLPDLVVRGRRVVLEDGVRPAAVQVRAGRILAVTPPEAVPTGCPVLEAGDLVIMAGLVDTHVHINEPGRTEWEGFWTATRAAAAGGVTTLMDMPLNSIPPTTSAAGLRAKIAATEGKLHVDLGLCAGLVPGNAGSLTELAREGALACKCFLAPSGVDEFPPVIEDDLRAGLRVLAGLGLPLLCHAELPGPLQEAALGLGQEDPRRYATYLRSRPRRAEDLAVELVARLSHEMGVKIHIVHLSSADALPLVRQAKERGAPFTVETCPHYLTFAAEEVPPGATEYKCAPPIREAENRERLWDALREGLIDQVVTDHSPSAPELKCSASGDFMRAWGGICSLQLALPAVWTALRERGGGPNDLVRLSSWMSARPAALVGLADRKGRIAPGCDADLVLWDPDAMFAVEPERLAHRHSLTPYRGRVLRGVVRRTLLRGQVIYEDGAFAPPQGVWLRGGRGI
ncbi:MAG: allantoinase AllB [Myxococcales bacterium]|nr:allantoinase AllB [Myxococcota bacterium]MDW8283056.1 allantoinase AllB [Myxococcales bacterium]